MQTCITIYGCIHLFSWILEVFFFLIVILEVKYTRKRGREGKGRRRGMERGKKVERKKETENSTVAQFPNVSNGWARTASSFPTKNSL